jgi:hypothetical protein
LFPEIPLFEKECHASELNRMDRAGDDSQLHAMQNGYGRGEKALPHSAALNEAPIIGSVMCLKRRGQPERLNDVYRINGTSVGYSE